MTGTTPAALAKAALIVTRTRTTTTTPWRPHTPGVRP